ncbi:MAG: Gfo/Idh/MocA family oxidoreductase [Kiritimatiellae bacterium]|nr:Gfo/Idh/MocA family oxidoreductase [Kiritimatiellia bacterium]
MDDLRIGVIGAGGRGRLARSAHKPGHGSRLVAGVDVRAQALEDFKTFVGPEARTCTDYRELVACDDIEAVFVTTPDFLHEEHAVAALQAGKAVYLEKPMAITIEGCDRILRTARETGSKLYCGHNMRHFPVILKMKAIIDSGVIGAVEAVWCRHFVGYGGDAYFHDWHSEARYTTGLLLQKAAHDIDVMHWLAGGYTRAVVGMGKLSVYNRCARRRPDQPGDASWHASNWPPLAQTGMSPVIDVEDHTMIMMQFDNGVQGSYVQCHYTPDSVRNYTFIGTHGRVENLKDYGDAKVIVYTQREGSELGPDITYHVKPKSGSHGGSDPDIVQTFVNFVRYGTQTNTSPIAARQAVATGVLGTKSARGGNTLHAVPPLDPDLMAYFENGQMQPAPAAPRTPHPACAGV